MAVPTVEVPMHLASLPTDARGFIVPAESPWVNQVPSVSTFDKPRTLGLAAGRACVVCGLPLPPGQTVWRIFTQRDAATARMDPEIVDDRSAPGHESCMLYSALQCPFWMTPGARLGKESTIAPGGKRGTKPALMGLGLAGLLVRPGVEIWRDGAMFFAYMNLTDDIRFVEPGELRERFEEAMRSDAYLADLPPSDRYYWTGSPDDEHDLQAYVEFAFPQIAAREPMQEVPAAEGFTYWLLPLERIAA